MLQNLKAKTAYSAQAKHRTPHSAVIPRTGRVFGTTTISFATLFLRRNRASKNLRSLWQIRTWLVHSLVRRTISSSTLKTIHAQPHFTYHRLVCEWGTWCWVSGDRQQCQLHWEEPPGQTDSLPQNRHAKFISEVASKHPEQSFDCSACWQNRYTKNSYLSRIAFSYNSIE